MTTNLVIPRYRKLVDKGMNSFTGTLEADETVVGDWFNTESFIQVIVDVITDEDSATDGLLFELRTILDGVEVIHTHAFSVVANAPGGHHYPSELEGEHVRISYTNGSGGPAAVKLITTFFDTMVEEGHSHNINYAFKYDHPAPIFRAVQTGFKPNGEAINAGYTAGGNPKTSIEEYDDTVNPVRKNIEGVGDLTVGVTEVEVAITGTPTYEIRIRADVSNTGVIFLGKTGVLADGSNDFVRLEAGDEVSILYDDTTNALYAISDTAAQSINVGVLL